MLSFKKGSCLLLKNIYISNYQFLHDHDYKSKLLGATNRKKVERKNYFSPNGPILVSNVQ